MISAEGMPYHKVMGAFTSHIQVVAFLSTVQKGDNALGSVHPCLSVCVQLNHLTYDLRYLAHGCHIVVWLLITKKFRQRGTKDTFQNLFLHCMYTVILTTQSRLINIDPVIWLLVV